MLTRTRKYQFLVGAYSIIAGIFLFWQLLYNGDHKDLASILVGLGFIGILISASKNPKPR